MGTRQLTFFIFLGLVTLTLGWESGSQYVYNYIGRSVSGINSLKQQNAVIEMHSRVLVQAKDDNTLTVKMTGLRIRRNGKYLGNPYFPMSKEEDLIQGAEEIDGIEDKVENTQQIETPFVITHDKGSVTGIKVGAEELLWVVNLKKSIASQLQLDITGVRSDGINSFSDSTPQEMNRVLNVVEDGLTGDCSTIIQVSHVGLHQINEHEMFHLGLFDAICKDKKVYEIVKTKDYNQCKNNPVYYSVSQPMYTCTLGTANCGNAMQRTSTTKYIGCGESAEKMTIIHGRGYNSLFVKPFGINSEDMVNTAITDLSLVTKETVSSKLSLPASTIDLKSLSYVFDDFKREKRSDKYAEPSLMQAHFDKSVHVTDIAKTVLETLSVVVQDLQEKPDSDQDNMERLAFIGRALSRLSVDELRSLWKQVKSHNDLTVSLLLDCLVQAGTNPTIMLLKELIGNKEIIGEKAVWAIAALGYFAKTPTRELLHELVNLVKSEAVQSSKTLKQTGLMTLADLMYAACESPYLRQKRFAADLLGDFCNRKDPVLVQELLPILVRELKLSEKSAADTIIALTAVGYLGVEEIIPVLLPFIEGNRDGDDTAERTRAIWSLHRVVYTNPEKVFPILLSLADNGGERPEVRMAAISMLLMSNAPLVVWQKLASRTWIDPSQQVASFVYSLIYSYSTMPPSTRVHQKLAEKAGAALANAKPSPFGLPYSWSNIQSSYLMEEDMSVMMHTPMFRISDEHWPVTVGNRYFYQLGPFTSAPLQIFVWNYNMADMWKSIADKLYGPASGSSKRAARDTGKELSLDKIWQSLNVARRPADKRAGVLHVNLLGSINRIFDLEQMEKEIPRLMVDAVKFQSQPMNINFTKFRVLAEYDMKIPTELGLPLLWCTSMPLLASIQGSVKGDGKGGLQSDISAELGWKLSSHLRVELPFNGNYIATGVDTRVEMRAPQQINWAYQNNVVQTTWTPGNKVVDMMYYHVKPFTISRNVADDVKAMPEDGAVNIISTTDRPYKSDFSLAESYGVDMRVMAVNELEHYDVAAMRQWIGKWDANSFFNLGFVPLSSHHRQYALRYVPETSTANAVSMSYELQRVTQADKRTVRFESAASSPTPFSSELVSDRPICESLRPVNDRLFEKMQDGGDALLIKAALRIAHKDGEWIELNTTLGLAQDASDTKDFADVRLEKFSSQVDGGNKAELALCSTTARSWNNPPSYGFSKNVLYLTHDSYVGFGSSCDQYNIRLKAKVYRNDTAAKMALDSVAGKQCQKDLAKGTDNDSAACTQARVLDQTYNVYELNAESQKLPDATVRALNYLADWFDNSIYQFVVDQRSEAGSPGKTSVSIKRNPANGDSDVKIVRPTEIVVAQQVRDAILPFTNIDSEYWNFYPLSAGVSMLEKTRNITSAGVSQAECHVGLDSVSTFDQVAYNYTMDQCWHVLFTDCWKESNIAVLGRQVQARKIVSVLSDQDSIEMDPSGTVTINGAKNKLAADSRFEIYDKDDKRVKAVVYAVDNAVVLQLVDVQMTLKVQASHVTITAPRTLRGRTCGVCGDYNQEVTAEFKTPKRCVLSSGDLMAASFKVNGTVVVAVFKKELTFGEGCSSKKRSVEDVVRRLKEESERCHPADQYSRSSLPKIELDQMTKCTTYAPLEMKWNNRSYKSTETSAQCFAGCKPAYVISKSFTFKATDGDEFRTTINVPSTCITA